MGTAFLLLVLAGAAGPDLGGVAEGTPIVSLHVIRHDVFDVSDPKTDSWPYRAANALHILSRESFVRSVLLFKPGDTVSARDIAESERLLRATGFLDPVFIRVRPVEGGAEVTVETWDQWTTEVSLNFSQLGGRRKNGFSIVEPNFLGYGKTVELETRSDAERDSVTVGYVSPLLLGTRWRLKAAYSDASDGAEHRFALEYPFFSLETPLAGGIEWRRDDLRDWLWSGGEKQVSGRTGIRDLRLWAGVRLPGGNGRIDRVTLGFFREDVRFSTWQWRADDSLYAAPANRKLQGVEIGWQRESDRWEVRSGFRAWRKQEDIGLGPNWRVLVGVSTPELGGDRTRLRLDGDLAVGRIVDDRYSWLKVSLDGRLERGDLVNTVTSVEVGRAKIGDTGFRGRLAIDYGTRLDRDQQLTLGADTGLRGWSPDTFDGTARAVTNIEWRRRMTGEVLHLGVLGLSAFADAGTTWNARVGRSTGGVHADAGVGLLVEITRAASLHVVRLEVAMPDDGSGPVFLATSGSLF